MNQLANLVRSMMVGKTLKEKLCLATRMMGKKNRGLPCFIAANCFLRIIAFFFLLFGIQNQS